MSSKVYYPSGTNKTPFNPQLEHFDMLCGQFIKENRMLKAVVIGLGVCLIFALFSIIIYEANRPATVPVLVTMNDFGETQYVGKVTKRNWQNFQIPEVAVNYSVREFVRCYHSLSTDKAVVRKNMEKAYHYLTATTAQKLSTLMKENDAYADFGTHTREVEFETDPLKISKDTYQLDYKVVRRQLSGQMSDIIRYRAALTIQTLDPAEEDIKDNPLGIYIVNFDIKELN